jgi:hypothetical protein
LLWLRINEGPLISAESNARRIVACVNVCKGTSTEKLESYVASGKTIQPAAGD